MPNQPRIYIMYPYQIKKLKNGEKWAFWDKELRQFVYVPASQVVLEKQPKGWIALATYKGKDYTTVRRTYIDGMPYGVTRIKLSGSSQFEIVENL